MSTPTLSIKSKPSDLIINGLDPAWVGRSLVIQRKRFVLAGVIRNGRTACVALKQFGGATVVTSAAAVQRAFLVKAGG